MAVWDIFIWFGISAMLLSAGGAGVSLMANDHWSLSSLRYRRLRTAAIGLASAALLIMIAFAVLLWISLGRPPLRTMGETRLWYSLFVFRIFLYSILRCL